ncbi:MAG: hypothetical protein J2P15_08730 [Micromonosporaceae bacterium]|nr:hypothetical protein [Micromonosporaceae bacterium]
MDTIPSWIAAIVGLVGGAIGVAGFFQSRSADRRAERAAAAAEQSASAAADSAAAAQAHARIEVEREHERLAPDLPARIECTETMYRKLRSSIRLERDFHVQVEALWNGSRSVVVPARLVQAGEVCVFEIEKWSRDTIAPPLEVLVRCWPPGTTDQAAHWSCPCGRPLIDSGVNGSAHWERRIGVFTPVETWNGPGAEPSNIGMVTPTEAWNGPGAEDGYSE